MGRGGPTYVTHKNYSFSRFCYYKCDRVKILQDKYVYRVEVDYMSDLVMGAI